MPTLEPVDFDPFAGGGVPSNGITGMSPGGVPLGESGRPRVMVGSGPKLEPVDFDPFGGTNTGVDMVKSGGAGIAQGAAGLVGLPGNAAEYGARGIDYLAQMVGEKLGINVPKRDAREPTFGSADVGKAITAALSELGIDANYKPKTKPGEYAKTVGEFVPAAILGPGSMARNIANFAVAPGIASEAAGQALGGTGYETAGRIGAALATGGLASAVNRPSGVERAIRSNMSASVNRETIDNASALMQDAAQRGVTLTWAEALEQVMPGAGLTNLQRVVESTNGGREALAPVFGNRPAQIERAAGPAMAEISPAAQNPSTIGPAIGRAAESEIEGVRGSINNVSQPFYERSQNVLLGAQEMAQIRALPGYPEAVRAIRNDPQLARYVQGQPENSVGFLNEVKKYLDTAAENATQPISAQGRNMQRSAGYGQDATAVREAGVRASGDYETALAIQSGGREQILQPLIDGPLGALAKSDINTRNAINALFPTNPLPNSAAEIGRTVSTLVRQNTRAARQLIRAHAESVFNEAAKNLQSGPNAFGGAKFANRIAGNAQQRANLQAAIEASGADGPRVWNGFNRFLDIMEATGTRQPIGSKTAFNAQDLKDLSTGGSVANAVKTGASPGKWVSTISDTWSRWQLGQNVNGIAEVLVNPRARELLTKIANQPVGSTSGQILAARIAAMGQAEAMRASERTNRGTSPRAP